MNPFGLHVTRVRADLPVSGIVAAEQLDAYLGTAAVYERARARAAAVLRVARRTLADARADAARMLEQASADAEARAAAAARDAHDAVLRDTVAWLVCERDIETAVAERVIGQCESWVARVVAAFAGEADRQALIATRVGAHLRELEAHGRFTVRLSPTDADEVRRRLPASPAFDVAEDPELEPGRAQIDSPFVRLDIDLNRQLDLLLRAVAGTATAGTIARPDGCQTPAASVVSPGREEEASLDEEGHDALEEEPDEWRQQACVDREGLEARCDAVRVAKLSAGHAAEDAS